MPEARIEIEAADGDGLDAFVACPDNGRSPPVILLAEGLTHAVLTRARRLAAHGFYVLVPEWRRRTAEDRREDVDAWLDHLADARRADDTRVAVVGVGPGANLALRVAAWRAERIAAAAAYAPRGFGPATAREIAQRVNGVVRLGCPLGSASPRLGGLESALAAAGVDFETELFAPEPNWAGLIDLLDRALRRPDRELREVTDVHLTTHNP